MKIITAAFLLTGILSTAAHADIPMVFEVPALEHACPHSPFGTACYHMTGGRNTRIPVPIIPDEPCEQVQLQLFELSERLEAPVGKPVTAACRDVTLEFPAVKALTYFRLNRIGIMTHGEKEFRTDTDPTHNTLLAVYPADQLENFREWSQSNRLIVKDGKQKISTFLEAQHIRFSRVNDPLPPEEKADTLCVFTAEDAVHDAPERCHAILLFREPLYALTTLREMKDHEKHIFEMDEALLPTLDSNPLIQRIFAQIIQAALEGDRL